jgi:hypothetical protein
LREEIYLQELKNSINAAQTIDESWRVVQGACQEMYFASVRMFIDGASYEAIFVRSPGEPYWKMNLVVGHSGYLALTRVAESRPHHLMGAVLFILEESLRNKSYVAMESAATATDITYFTGVA